jgi:hypothetical protein
MLHTVIQHVLSQSTVNHYQLCTCVRIATDMQAATDDVLCIMIVSEPTYV